MNKRENTLHYAEDAAHTVYASYVTAIDTNNGILNEEKLKHERENLFRKATQYLQEEFITETQRYPVGDISSVEMDIDFVAVKREDWQEIIDYLAGNE